jgi:hypothetical protein
MIIKSLDFKGFPYDDVFFFTWTGVSRSAGYKWMDTWIVVVWVGDDQLWRESAHGAHLVIAIVICSGLFEMREKLQVDKAL